MKKVLIITYVITASLTMLAAEKVKTTPKKEATMRPIAKWQDVAPFADLIVAYSTTSHYIKPSRLFHNIHTQKDMHPHRYKIGGLYFGYIRQNPTLWQGNEKGYEMQRLVADGQGVQTCALVNSEIKSSSLVMRKATGAELTKIFADLKEKSAEFEYDIRDNPLFEQILQAMTSPTESKSVKEKDESKAVSYFWHS